MEVTGINIFILVIFGGMFSILFGLPGTVIILFDAILYAAFTGFNKTSFKILIILLLLSLVAEALDFTLGSNNTVKLETSASAIWVSLIGAFIGAIIMTPILLGLGTIIGCFLGGFLAVVTTEFVRQSQVKQAFRNGYRVIFRKFTGMFAKGVFALIMIIITLTNIYS